jgi:hypothetical protein
MQEVKNMVEKRSEASLVKARFNQYSLHFALPMMFFGPSLGALTLRMRAIPHGTGPKVFEPRYAGAQSNKSALSDALTRAAGLTRYEA